MYRVGLAPTSKSNSAQAIQNVSATQSGIRSLPLVLSQVVASIVAGIATTVIGYYTPFLYLSTVLSSIGAGLLMTLKIDSGIGQWLGYQIILGLGTGSGFQVPLIAAQTALPLDDVPIGVSIIMFIQMLGGALFVSVGQNTFTNTLLQNLQTSVPDLDPKTILGTGATALRNIVDPSKLGLVLEAYNGALTKTFRISLILACLTLIGSVLMEWRSVKGKETELVA